MPIRSLILLLYFLSGFSALIYEIIWARMLGIVIGTSVAAWGTILAVFMGGMALGCWAGGKTADRISRPLLLFALCETGIALFGAGSPSFLGFLQGVFNPLLNIIGEVTGFPVLPRIIASACLMALPTLLMGCTFPAVSRALFSGERPYVRDLSIIYSVNTLGAMAGCIAAGFILLPLYGMNRSLLLAAGINCSVAVAALVIGLRRRDGITPSRSGDIADTDVHGPFPPWLLPSVIACSGFCAMAFEVLWSRGLVFFLTSTTYSFTTVLGVVLAGIAFGSMAAAVIARSPARITAWIAGLQLCIGLYGLALPWILQNVGSIIVCAESHAALSWTQWLTARYLFCSLIILLPSLCMGATFPLVTGTSIRSLSSAGRAVGSLSSLNTLGGITGALTAAFLLIPSVGTLRSVAIVALINCACGLAVVRWGMKKSRRWTFAGAVLWCVLGAASLHSAGRSPLVLSSRAVRDAGRPVSLVSYEEDAAAGVAVLEDNRGRTLNIDGFNAAGTYRYEYMHLLGHLPVLLSPSPDTVLVVCLGTGTTCGAAVLHPAVKRIDCAEISPAVIASARYFRNVNHHCADSPKVRIICEDGRNHLLTTGRRYDVITLEPMHPFLSSATNLYSSDFYRLCRSRLSEQGIMAQWAPMHAVSPQEYRMLIASFARVFPHSSLWFMGTEGILIGSVNSLRIDIGTLKSKMSYPAVAADLVSISLNDPARLLSCFMMGEKGIRSYIEGSPAISDDRPRLEFSAPRNLVLPAERMWRENAKELLGLRVPVLPILLTTDSIQTAEITGCTKASSLIIRTGILNAEGRFYEAIGAADSALALMPGDTTAGMLKVEAAGKWARVCLNSARGLRSRGLVRQAEEAYLQATDADPHCEPAHTELASLYSTLGMPDKSLEHAEKAVMSAPDNPAVHVNLAAACMNCGHYAEAEQHLLLAVALDEKYGRAHFLLAELFRETGRDAMAQTAMKRAGELGYKQQR